jgi:mRNA-degrading endonuclease RelE of RelBE toxin-antitoxin system
VARTLHPQSKARVRAAIDGLRPDPTIGRPLRDELTGLWRYPVGRLRIVYRFDDNMLEVVSIGPRAVIYEELARRVRSRP